MPVKGKLADSLYLWQQYQWLMLVAYALLPLPVDSCVHVLCAADYVLPCWKPVGCHNSGVEAIFNSVAKAKFLLRV